MYYVEQIYYALVFLVQRGRLGMAAGKSAPPSGMLLDFLLWDRRSLLEFSWLSLKRFIGLGVGKRSWATELKQLKHKARQASASTPFLKPLFRWDRRSPKPVRATCQVQRGSPTFRGELLKLWWQFCTSQAEVWTSRHFWKKAESCFKSTVSEQKKNSRSSAPNSVSSERNSDIQNNRLKGTHWALSPELREGKKTHWVWCLKPYSPKPYLACFFFCRGILNGAQQVEAWRKRRLSGQEGPCRGNFWSSVAVMCGGNGPDWAPVSPDPGGEILSKISGESPERFWNNLAFDVLRFSFPLTPAPHLITTWENELNASTLTTVGA